MTRKKTSNVVALKGDLIPGSVHGDTVEVLEELLGMAKRGEIVGLVYGAVRPNRFIKIGSVGGPDNWCLIAAANLAAQDLLNRLLDDD